MSRCPHCGQVVPYPPLDIDKRLGPPSVRGKAERRIVWALMEHLIDRGFHLYRLNDGECMTRIRGKKHAMELVFNLDEASLRFRKDGTGAEHGVLLVLGNSEDVISDWNYTEGDADGFGLAMDAFKAEEHT